MIQVLRTIQANGIQGLSEADRKKYVPPVGGGFGGGTISLIDQIAFGNITSSPYGPGSYQYSQARVVADHLMTQVLIPYCIWFHALSTLMIN